MNQEEYFIYTLSRNRTGSLHKIIQYLREESVTPEKYRFFLIMNFASMLAFALHVGFIILFGWLGITFVAWLNVGSCLIYSLIFLVNRKGFHDFAAGLGLVEVVGHAILAVMSIGWDSGFQYYMLAILPFIFLNTLWPGYTKYVAVVVLYMTFTGLLYTIRGQVPNFVIPQQILDYINGVNLGIFFLIFSCLAFYYSTLTKKVEERLTQANEKLVTLAAIDDLTGLFNRREMRRILEEEILRCRADLSTFVVILGDIDDFKQINDNFGHHAGDYILTLLTNVMQKSLRKDDKLSRWGGEEFLLMLPSTDLNSAKVVAEKLREKIALTEFVWEDHIIKVTMTFGVGIFTRICSFNEVMRRADHALIQGKSMGKNCVVVSPFPT